MSDHREHDGPRCAHCLRPWAPWDAEMYGTERPWSFGPDCPCGLHSDADVVGGTIGDVR